MIRTLIIDDEQLNIDLLVFEISKFCPELEIVGNADNVPKAIELILKLKPQLVFCDIQIHDQTGFDVIDAVQNESIHFILVSAFDHYGMKAVKHSVVDYLLKPVQTQELIYAVRKVIRKINTDVPTKISASHNNQFLSIPHKEDIEIVKYADIIHLEASGNYTQLFTIQNKKIISSKSIGDFEAILPTKDFIRVHKSHIVNVNFIVKFIRSKTGSIELSNKKEIQISANKKQELYDKLGIK